MRVELIRELAIELLRQLESVAPGTDLDAQVPIPEPPKPEHWSKHSAECCDSWCRGACVTGNAEDYDWKSRAEWIRTTPR